MGMRDRQPAQTLNGDEWRHLPYEWLEAYADGRLSEIDHEIVEGHASACPACAAEMQDLLGFRDSLAFLPTSGRPFAPTATAADPQDRPSPWARLRSALLPVPLPGRALAFCSAALVAAVIGGGSAGVQTARLAGRERGAARASRDAAAVLARAESLGLEVERLRGDAGRGAAERAALLARIAAAERGTKEALARASTAAALLASAAPVPTSPAAASPRPRGERRGGGKAVASAPRRLEAPEPAAAEPLPGAVRVAMADGRLPGPPDLSRLASVPTWGVTRGADEPGPIPGFTLVSPAGTRVLSERPAFRWRPAPGAARYEVYVADLADDPVTPNSGRVTGTRWSLPPGVAPLPRGRVLVWEVHAYDREGAEIGMAGEGRFEVVPQEEARRVRRLAARGN
jgi:hypothetical protein